MKEQKIYEKMSHDYDTIYTILTENEIATEKEIELVGYIKGFSVDTLTDILFVRTGYREICSFDHYELEDYYFNYLADEEEG
jgi:hypothetical protein